MELARPTCHSFRAPWLADEWCEIAPLTVTPFHRYQFTCVRRPARSLSEYLPDAIASGGPQWSVGWLSRPAEAECTDARPEAGAVPETV